MKPNKIIALLIVLGFLYSSGLVIPANAQFSPSTPQFTVQYIDRSYTEPPIYGTDPYTGKTIQTGGGNYVDNRTIDVTIQNQPFTPYQYGNSTVYLFYAVRSKGHYEDWGTAGSGFHSQDGIKSASGGSTLVTFFINYWGINSGGQVDFQVKAVLAYTVESYSGGCFTGSTTNTVAESSWSSTATIIIGDTTPTSVGLPDVPAEPTLTPMPTVFPTSTAQPTQNPTSAPSQLEPTGTGLGLDMEQTALIVMAVIIEVLLVVVALLWRKTSKKKTPPSP